MAVQTSYPGVYIDEFAPGAPIQGVGTNTAAFMGPTQRGTIREPTRITSWDQFKDEFGEQPLSGFYLWHAVRGFFDNGGQICYVVRVSNGEYAEVELDNANGDATLRVRSEQPGTPATTVQLTRTNVVSGASGYEPTGTVATVVSTKELELSSAEEAAQFRPGDEVVIVGQATRAMVRRISEETVTVSTPLTVVAGDTLRLADAIVGTRTIRLALAGAMPTIQSSAGRTVNALTAGTILTLTQGAVTDTVVVESVQTENFTAPGPTTTTTYRVTLRDGLGSAFTLDGTGVSVQSEEFDLTVTDGAPATHSSLGFDTSHPRYFEDIVNEDSNISVQLLPMDPPPPATLGAGLAVSAGPTGLAGGAVEDLSILASQDFVDALEELERIDDVNLVAAPDAAAEPAAVDRDTVQQAIISHCELVGDRFGILDSGFDRTISGADSVEVQRSALDSARGYAALYFPWLRVPPPSSGPSILVPPSGHICGVIARSDSGRGVHKAPANELIANALGVQYSMSDVEQGILNLQGINVIRVFSEGGRPTVWGARTTATDTNWQYISTRRLFLFLEESIEEGIRWAVFEPNNLSLWQKLKRTLTAFLNQQWRAGALFGETAEDAYYVRIDEVLNPFSEQQLGRLHIEIGVRPTYPAEFIIVRIGIWDGGSEITEG